MYFSKFDAQYDSIDSAAEETERNARYAAEADAERAEFLAREQAECDFIDAMSDEDQAAWFAIADGAPMAAATGWARAVGLRDAA